ncbi:protein argonaute-2-like [Haemaphysalis longicornis]
MTAEPPAKPSKWRPSDDPGCVLEEQRKASPKLQVLSVGPGRARKSSPSYSPLKNIAESVLGIVTQCMTGQNVPKRCNPSTIVNILQKLNAKLGGTNNTTPAVKTIIFKNPVMTIGADVTQPALTEMSRPSAAAAVASLDRLAFRYVCTFCIQKQSTVATARIEVIEDMKYIARELLLGFYRINKGVKPANIFYRDGVSEGQFSQVQQHEVVSLQAAYSKFHPDYEPVITFLDIRMRQHHTRFMQRDPRDGCEKFDDAPVGAVVYTFVTHTVDFGLFLCSHFGIQGKSLPAYY